MKFNFDLDGEIVSLIQKDAIQVPPYPSIALRIRQLTLKSDYGLADLTRLVEADPALSAAALRLANSAFYGSTVRATSLSQAITRIGGKAMTEFALAATLGKEVLRAGTLGSLRRTSWQHSLASARICHSLAPARGLPPDEAFLSGLLHDFGEAIGIACVEEILRKHPETQPLPEETWAQVVGKYHVELGMVVATKWGLPPEVADCISGHHGTRFELCDNPKAVELVALSDALSRRLLKDVNGAEVALALPSLCEGDQATLRDLFPRLPHFLASLEMNPIATKAPEVSLVAEPATVLGKDAYPASFSARVNVERKNEQYLTQQISASGVRLKGKVPLRERTVVEVQLGPEGKTLTLWMQVRICKPEGDEHVLELQPFAAANGLREAWTQLSTAAGAAATKRS